MSDDTSNETPAPNVFALELIRRATVLNDQALVLSQAGAAGAIGIGADEKHHDAFRRSSTEWAERAVAFDVEAPGLLDPQAKEMADKVIWADNATDEELHAAAEEALARVQKLIEEQQGPARSSLSEDTGGLVADDRQHGGYV